MSSHNTAGIMVEWQVEGIVTVEHKTSINRILYSGPDHRQVIVPLDIQRALIYALIPVKVLRQRSLENMPAKGKPGVQLQCHGIFTAKARDNAYEAIMLKDRGVTVIKLAHVKHQTWIVVPRNDLRHSALFTTVLQKPTTQAPSHDAESRPLKRAKLGDEHTSEAPASKTMLVKARREIDSLFAMATFKAEVMRAAKDKVNVNLEKAHARFDKLQKGKGPMHVFVLWSSITREGCVEEHADVVPFSKLYDTSNRQF